MGRREEAIESYRKNLGARVELMLRYKEKPGAAPSRHAAARLRR